MGLGWAWGWGRGGGGLHGGDSLGEGLRTLHDQTERQPHRAPPPRAWAWWGGVLRLLLRRLLLRHACLG